MSKLQGLKHLERHFDFNMHHMAQILLYKNLPADKLLTYQLGLGLMVLRAKECRDIAWALNLIRLECLQGLTGTEPEGYDPYYAGDGNPPATEPRPYDAYWEMSWQLHPDDTPHGLGLDLSPDLLAAVGSLLVSKAAPTITTYGELAGGQPMTWDEDANDWRPMTKQELTKYSRREEARVLEECLFTVGFNDDMARLRQLVAERGSLTEILDLIGPEPIEEQPA